MNLQSVVKTALEHKKDGKKFLAAAGKTVTGENVSTDSMELAEHVDELFDGHAEAARGIGKAFTKFSEHVTDDGGNVDDGILEDSAEVIVRAVETLVNSDVVQKTGELAGPAIGVAHDALREAAKKTSEIVHGATRAMTAAGGITAKGMPEIEGIEEHVEAIETSADDLAESTKEVFDTLREKAPDVLDAVDPSGAVGEAVEACVEQAGETIVELVGEVAAEELAESVAEVIPGVGIIVPSYHLIHGAGKATAGISSLVTGGIMALVGGVYGAAAAPFDGGAAWGKVMNVSRKPSAWGASMSAEGGLIAAKGAMGYANQIPGAQLATVPAKVACKVGATWINRLRNSSSVVDSRGDDDFEGVTTEEMMQTGTTYQVFSADGKRLLRASNTKSSRCLKFFGYAYGGYSLTFEGPPPPSSSAETREEQDQQEEREEKEECSSSFSFSGCPGAYRLHSGMHGDNTLFFLGACYPAEWVVWDVGGKTDGAWEKLEMRWREGGEKFTISGHGGQHVKWRQSEGVFKGTRNESKATEFVLKEKSSRSGRSGGGGGSSSSSSSS